MLRLAHRTHLARREACHSLAMGSENTGGLSIVQVKEIFTSQVGPMDPVTGPGFMMLDSSHALWCHTLKSRGP